MQLKFKILLTLALFFILAAGAFSQTTDGPATLPTIMAASYKTYPVQPSATSWPVTSGSYSSLQTQINNAAANCGSTGADVSIPVASYAGTTGLTAPTPNCDSSHWVVIHSANISSLPPQGTRINPATDAANMPTITTSDASSLFLVGDAPTSPPKGYWLAGLNFDVTQVTGNETFIVVQLGDYCTAATGAGCPIVYTMTQANLADRMAIDRVWIHGHTDSILVHHGIRFTTSHLYVGDSVIKVKDGPTQAIAISSDFSMGPIELSNDDLIGFGEDFFLGGSTATIQSCGTPPISPPVTPGCGSTPSDVYVHGSHLHKDPAWMNLPGDQRSLFECKNASRMLFEGNIFDTDVIYKALLFFPISPDQYPGGELWATCSDITVRYNKIANVNDGIEIDSVSGGGGTNCPNGCTALPSKRFSIHDNVFENINVIWVVPCANGSSSCGNGRFIHMNFGLPDTNAGSSGCGATPSTDACRGSDIWIFHNTVASPDQPAHGFSSPFDVQGGDGQHYNIRYTDNVVPAGSFGFISSDGHPINSSSPLSTVLSSFYIRDLQTGGSGSEFDFNAITGYLATGAGNPFVSPACNFTCASQPGMPTAMANVGFANWNSGIGGDYRVCFANGVPPGCTATSQYVSLASDGLGTTTQWNNRSPGADIDAVNQMTACTLTGKCLIQALRSTGPYTGDWGEHFLDLQMPGYTGMRIGDGGGVGGGNVPANTVPLFMSGFGYHWWDLNHDPQRLHDLGGWDAGALGFDILGGTGNGNSACGTAATQDNKAFYGTVSLLYSNNVRAAYKLYWPVTAGGVGSLTPVPNLFGDSQWVIYRPGKIAERIAFDNTCGSLVTWILQATLNTHWQSFTHPPNGQANSPPPGGYPLLQYPPRYFLSWDDNYFQHNDCGTGSALLQEPCTQAPWRFVNMTGSPIGMIMHSVAAGESCPATQANCGSGSMFRGYTPGSTTDWTSGQVYPIYAELELIGANTAAGFGGATGPAYRGLGSIGMRSKLQYPVISVPANGTDSFIDRWCAWYGAFGINNAANAALRQTECQTPPTPTMNAGTSPTYNQDRMDWTMTANATPKVDFNTTGTMYDPTFCVTAWNGSIPIVTIGGVTQTENVNYVQVNNPGGGDPCTGLLLQFVNTPNTGLAGDMALPNATHVVITAGALPPSGAQPKSITVGITKSGLDDENKK